MRERGALTLILDQVRSRTGIFQEPFNDGLMDMIIKDEKDITFVPINITYEEVPDLSLLIELDLKSKKKKNNTSLFDGLQRTRTTNRMSTPTKVSRPSDSRAQRVRSRSLGNGQLDEYLSGGQPIQVSHVGRLLVGIGSPISLLHDIKRQENIPLSQSITHAIQKGQKQCIAVSPISLISAILLYSRVKGNCIDMGTFTIFYK
jgi:glycerol-3-phosphate O-acyltransferase